MSHADDGALHAYLDGQLTPVERSQLAAHLASCAACRARLDEERALIERADALLGAALPPERAAPPFHALRPRATRRRLVTPLAWAATVLLALGGGWFLGSRWAGRPSAPPTTVAVVPESAGVFGGFSLRDRDTGSRSRTAPGAAVRRQPPATTVTPDSAAATAVAVTRGMAGAAAGGAAPPPVSIVPIQPRPTMQAAEAPEPAAANPLVVTRKAARPGAAAVILTTSWPIIGLDAARPTLGADPVTIPGLPVRDVRRSPLGDGVVLVEQALDSARVIQLFQRRAENVVLDARSAAPHMARPGAVSKPAEGGGLEERLARYIGSLRVEIAGPLPADSLSKLLELVK